MVTQTLFCRGPEGAYDPYRNLAVEKYLTFRVREGECILFLWQNRRTVVIGRNQNAWKECNTDALAADGGHLARRLSGGGAVFHDLGNLNFSFCVRKEDYDVDRQLEVIRLALRREGIETCKSGRNDLLAEGRKFSGNAFLKSGNFCCHHGTIMIDVDRELIGRYLHVPERKLLSKGITSVQSRVVNLKELCPHLTVEELSVSLREAFSEIYGCETRECGFIPDIYGCDARESGSIPDIYGCDARESGSIPDIYGREARESGSIPDIYGCEVRESGSIPDIYGCETRERGFIPNIYGHEARERSLGTAGVAPDMYTDAEQIRKDAAFFASREWIFGTRVPFSHQLEGDFSWGGAQILLQVEQGTIAECRIHSDAMDQDGIEQISEILKGCRYEKKAVLDRLEKHIAQQTGDERHKMLLDIRDLMEKEMN